MKRRIALTLLALVAGFAGAQPAATPVLRDSGSLPRDGFRTISAPADGRLQITVVSPDFEPVLVVDSGGERREYEGSGASVRAVVPVRAGESVTIVVDVAPRTGYPETGHADYLMVAVLLPYGEPLAVGGSIVDSLVPGDERRDGGAWVRWYDLELPANTAVRVRLSSTDFDAYLVVETPDGGIYENDDASGSDSALTVQSSIAGAARVGASTFGDGESGAFELSAALLGSREPWDPDGYRLRDGETVTGSLDPASMGDGHRYTFSSGGGERVELVLRSEEFDSYLQVMAPDGAEYSDDDSGGGYDALLQIMAGRGIHDVIVSGVGDAAAGGYTLTFRSLGAVRSIYEAAGTLSERDPSDIMGRAYQTHRFAVAVGQQVHIDVRSSEFDAYAVLRDGRGRILARDDDSGGNSDARIVYVGERAEQLELVVTSYDPESYGAYEVVVSE